MNTVRFSSLLACGLTLAMAGCGDTSDGTAFKQLTSDGKQKFLPHFSPDGSKLVYTKFLVGGFDPPEAVTEIAVFDLASGHETLVTSGATMDMLPGRPMAAASLPQCSATG